MAMYGYVRVSTREQHTDRQVAAMRDFSVSEENIFQDKQSGKNFERSAYQKLLIMIKEIRKLKELYLIMMTLIQLSFQID